jgi:hypothetical protein
VRVVKKLVYISVLTVVFFVSCAQKSLTSYSVEIPTSAINAYLKKEFPVEKKLPVGKLIVKDPKASIDDINNRIKVGSSLLLKIPFFPEQTGKIYVSGNIAFDQQKKELYLVDPKLENLSFNNQSLTKHLPSNIRGILSDVISDIFKQTPIYKIDENSIKGKFLKDIKIQNGKLLLIFGL